MIVIGPIHYTASAGEAPYSYVWDSDVSCVTFSNPSGTSINGQIQTTITFDTEACLTSATITLKVIDNTGCSVTETVTVDNPCSNFTFDTITYQAPYTFIASGSNPECRTIDIEWDYDDLLFKEVSQIGSGSTSTLTLSLNSALNSYPATTTIIATGTDCKGCEIEETYVLPICIPQAQSLSASLSCDDEAFKSGTITIRSLTGCTGATIDWTTLNVTLPSGFTYTQGQVGGEVVGKINIQAPLSTTPGSYTGQYTVKTTDGIISTTGNINITVADCAPEVTIYIPNKTIQVDCSDMAGDVIEIEIEDDIVVASGATIDWSSWMLVTPPSPTSPSITLGTNSSGDRVINYEIPSPMTGSDSFGWTLCDTDGKCASTATFVVVLDCPTPPTATADSYCTPCGETTVLDVLTNDLGGGSPLDISSVSITSSPTKGVASLPGNGTILYTPNSGQIGADSLQYTVKNTSGSESSAATVTIDIICAGEVGAVSVCNS